jgi:hypothetical protein
VIETKIHTIHLKREKRGEKKKSKNFLKEDGKKKTKNDLGGMCSVEDGV